MAVEVLLGNILYRPTIKVGYFEVPYIPIPVEVTKSKRIFLRVDHSGNAILNVNTDGRAFVTLVK